MNERTPKKPEYLIAQQQLTERGLLGFGPIQFLMESNLISMIIDLTKQLAQLV